MSAKISKKRISVRMKTYNAPKHKACSNKQCAMIGVICSNILNNQNNQEIRPFHKTSISNDNNQQVLPFYDQQK